MQNGTSSLFLYLYVASVLKIQDYSSCDFAVEEGFTELPVRGTFAGSELTLAIVDEDFH